MDNKQQYYSVKEVSNILGLSEDTIRGWIYRTKKMKAVKIGGAVRVSREEIERLIKPIE